MPDKMLSSIFWDPHFSPQWVTAQILPFETYLEWVAPQKQAQVLLVGIQWEWVLPLEDLAGTGSSFLDPAETGAASGYLAAIGSSSVTGGPCGHSTVSHHCPEVRSLHYSPAATTCSSKGLEVKQVGMVDTLILVNKCL